MLLQTFEAVFANAFGEKPDLIDPEIRCHCFRKRDLLSAGRLFTDFTVEVEMPVFMGIFAAAVVAELVFRGGIFLDAVHDSLFFKRFQGTVNRSTVGILKMAFHFG